MVLHNTRQSAEFGCSKGRPSAAQTNGYVFSRIGAMSVESYHGRVSDTITVSKAGGRRCDVLSIRPVCTSLVHNT